MRIRPFVLRAFFAAAAVASATSASAQAPSHQDVAGVWNITMTSPQGSHPTTLTIREEGEQLRGTLTGLASPGPVTVALTEGGVTLSFSSEYQGQSYPVVMRGKITGSDIKGTVDYANGAAAGDFSGSKAGAGGNGTAAGAAAAGSVTGVWNITGDRGDGYSFKLTQDGTAVTGTLTTPDGREVPVKGTLENGGLTLAPNGDPAAGTITGTFDGTTLKGRYAIGDSTGSWSATRKP